MRTDNRFESIDRAALHDALLAMGRCPHCRTVLRPVAFFDHVYGCAGVATIVQHDPETWYLPELAQALDDSSDET